MDAQNSGSNELMKFNESGRASSSVSSLSLVSFCTRQRDFLSWRFQLWWRVFCSWEIFAMRCSCSLSTTFNSDFNLLNEQFRDSNERLMQRQPQQTHSTHLGWFFIATQRRSREVQCSQRKRMVDFFLWISWVRTRQLQNLNCIFELRDSDRKFRTYSCLYGLRGLVSREREIVLWPKSQNGLTVLSTGKCEYTRLCREMHTLSTVHCG